MVTDEETMINTNEMDTEGNAYDFLCSHVKEPSLSALYDYLSLCGQFQFPNINPEMWSQFEAQYGNG